MKRILFGMAVAVAAMLSACQQIEQPKAEIQLNEEAVVFTATLAADTKTYIEYDEANNVYKTKWSESDGIWLFARQSDTLYLHENCVIMDGVGTTSAKFTGTLKSDHYKAYYGYGWYDEMGNVYPNFQQYQGSRYEYDAATGSHVLAESFADYALHMYAESDDTNFEFKNLGSVLKVSLTGTDYIDNVVFTPNDPTIAVAGKAYIQTDEAGELSVVMANDSTSRNNVTYILSSFLNEQTPTNCYIVLPPQTYTGGFTITINSASGNMTRSVYEDVTLERSQIRSLSPIAYRNENVHSWALIGSMSGWSEDITMTFNEDAQYYELNEIYLTTEDEFKFRANGTWDTNFGAYDSPVQANTSVGLISYGPNIKVATEGTYNIILDLVNAVAYFELVDGVVNPVYCSSYDEVAALPEETLIQVEGYVFGTYARGFILNIGQYYGNCILVYQGADQSAYPPVMGNRIIVTAYNKIYNGLPELYNIQSIEVLSADEIDYGYNQYYYNLMNSADFEAFNANRYEYVKYTGILQYTGTYYNIKVDGVTTRYGSLSSPSQDLTEFIDQRVVVEGWFAGFSGGEGQYLTTIVKNIYSPENEGGTENIVPGEDIVIPSDRLQE